LRRIENIIRNVFLLLIVIIFCVSCQKRDIDVIQQNDTLYNSVPGVASVDINGITAKDTTSLPELENSKSIQEIIEWYAVTSTEQKRGLFAFQIEGNFTGSGNREIIVFYEFFSLVSVYCFIYNSSGEEIERVYQIKYRSLEFNEEEDIWLSEALGREIIWKNQIICRVGDFNGNGKDELYLYSISGISKRPLFFEFDGMEFVEILDLGTVYAFITNVDPVEKIITLRITLRKDAMEPITIILTNSYTWDNATNRYELLSTDPKYYRWNVDINGLEEVEG